MDPGSFRDPAGCVLHLDGQIYRRVGGGSASVITQLEQSGLLREWSAGGWIVETRLLESGDPVIARLGGSHGDGFVYLHHQKIPWISYPYEWPVTMLADAARHQLELQMRLLAHGFSLKDASAYNIQFVGGRPVFIDVPSIEKPARLDIWVAYAQFCRMFLFPLFMHRYAAGDTKAYFLAYMDGMDIEQVYRCLGGWRTLRPGLFMDVFLQRALHRYSVHHGSARERGILTERSTSHETGLLNLQRLVKKTRALGRPRTGAGVWLDYERTHSYTQQAEQEKMAYIQRFLQERHPAAVIDLGSNTGQYSFAAAEAGCRTVAVDSDHDCVDALYRRVRETHADILPLWMDLANPSPATGFRNQERSSFLVRAQFDAVFALALVHHLLVASRIPLEDIRDFLAGMTRQWLVVEFIAVEDPMFQTLLALRDDLYGHVTQEYFEAVFSGRFRIVERHDISGACRTLYTLEILPGTSSKF
jgi:SAM-dependent methyltransferase